ncbi:threonine synthase [Sulfurovum lithotrophicum]|uniref:Threonine synthase n=1 Tax=Sulfurovum lithotrophicum TaxID=206403 RepID=A0A7U4M0K2_9BACT|nr:threonine synthase [Sulfurovum lithotrophicum]AKF24594.1 threonine synthase [Sulfurovum lithotrophicum]
MQFIETRGNDGKKPSSVQFSEAILSPSASFGGLYVPQTLPELDRDFLTSHLSSHYKSLALDFLDRFGIDISKEVLEAAVDRYDGFDNPQNPVPVVQIENDCFVSELYHGQTRAFKDMALQPFGYILSKTAQQRGENYLIMAATSGDTGPATLETFKNQANIKVACLYPDGGTSDVQRLQMVTEDAENLKVIGVKGNFDDTQHALKELLASEDFKAQLEARGIKLSAANSVNFGRIIFQIIYHIHSYLALVREEAIAMGEEVYMVVPSGNFGNALGAYYAKKAGLPVKKILIASNINNILSDWINTGIYDISDRELVLTESPAMDILKSSNIERVMFDKFGAERTKELMEALNANQRFELTPEELASLQEDFAATFSNDEEGEAVIAEYAKKGYIMDPHTATCFKAYRDLREEKIPTILYSTAEWTKFSTTVSKALGHVAENDLEALKWVSEKANVPVPFMISALFGKPVIHDTIVDKEDIKGEMLNFL